MGGIVVGGREYGAGGDGTRVHAFKVFLDDKAIGRRVAQPRYRLP
jgi:hypothetical protein